MLHRTICNLDSMNQSEFLTCARSRRPARGQARHALRLCQPRPAALGSRPGQPRAALPARRRSRRARAGRAAEPRGAQRALPVIDSAICLIEGGRLYYRGHDAVRLAETATLENRRSAVGTSSESKVGPPRRSFAAILPPPLRRRVPRLQAAKLDPLPRKRGRAGVGSNRGLSIIERCQIHLAELAARRFGGARSGRRMGLCHRTDDPLRARRLYRRPLPTATDPVHEQLAALWHLDARAPI